MSVAPTRVKLFLPLAPVLRIWTSHKWTKGRTRSFPLFFKRFALLLTHLLTLLTCFMFLLWPARFFMAYPTIFPLFCEARARGCTMTRVHTLYHCACAAQVGSHLSCLKLFTDGKQSGTWNMFFFLACNRNLNLPSFSHSSLVLSSSFFIYFYFEEIFKKDLR